MANVDAAEEDRIVRTIDVHICSPKTVSSHAQVQLLQYPLRPPWRPYDVGQCTGVRVKTGMRRLEMDLPVDRQSRNYDPEAKEDVGRFTSDGKLLLLPVAESVLMRPKTSHFDAALKAHAASTARSLEGEAADTKEPPTQQLHRLEVQVRKRETERQAEQRMRSYQWLSEQDAKEPWMDLQVITNASSFASVTWDQVAQDAGLGTDPAIMDRRDYFELAFPPTESTNSSAAAPSSGSPDGAGSGGSGDGIAASGGGGAAGAGTLRSGGLSPASASAGGRLDLGLQRELTQAVTTLLKQHSVGNMADIRGWLLTSPERLRELGQSKDDVLHEALMATGVVDRIRTTYVLRSTGDPALDEVRSIILELLAHKETVKKSDVMEAAARRGLNVTGGQYQRCIKDLCSSRGNSWFIKPGKES